MKARYPLALSLATLVAGSASAQVFGLPALSSGHEAALPQSPEVTRIVAPGTETAPLATKTTGRKLSELDRDVILALASKKLPPVQHMEKWSYWPLLRMGGRYFYRLSDQMTGRQIRTIEEKLGAERLENFLHNRKVWRSVLDNTTETGHGYVIPFSEQEMPHFQGLEEHRLYPLMVAGGWELRGRFGSITGGELNRITSLLGPKASKVMFTNINTWSEIGRKAVGAPIVAD
jgi:hypothetical protein